VSSLEPAANGWRAVCGEHVIDAAAVVLAAGGRCYREAKERGELSTNHPGATGEVTQIALDLGAESRDLDALQYHPNGGAWPSNMQGYSIPETTRAYGATLLNAEGKEFTDPLGPRDEVSQAIFDEVEAGRGVETPYAPHPRGGRGGLAAVHAPPLPCGRGRPAGGGDPDLPGAPLPERGPRDRRPGRDDARRCVRVRRDRRRHARAQPDDGQLAARVHGLRQACRRGRGREGSGMSAVATDLQQAVEDAAAYLYVWALKDIPQDLRDALADAQQRETSVPGQRVLNTIVKNVGIADDEKNLVCQDTGIAVYTCRVGE